MCLLSRNKGDGTETYSENRADHHAVVRAESALVAFGEGYGELLAGVGLAALQRLESKVKTTREKEQGMVSFLYRDKCTSEPFSSATNRSSHFLIDRVLLFPNE